MGPAHQPGAFALEVVETLIEAGHEAVWAGGCVRDLLMGREPGDFDIATDARPDQVREVFGRARSFAVGASFGVVLVRDRDGREDPVEVATFRTEGTYADGRHPDAVQFATRQDDARRRDFTINGMFMDPRTGDVFDDVGGRQDIERGLVRAIGEPEARINEDKLRMLRAIRFTASLGFALDPATAEAIAAHSQEITVVSAERIADEWRRMLSDSTRAVAVRLAIETGLLASVFPEVPVDGYDAAVERLGHLPQAATATVALAVLLVDVTDPGAMCERLKLSNRETDEVTWLVASRGGLDQAADQKRSRLFPLLAHPSRDGLLELIDAIERGAAGSGDDVAWCRALLETVGSEELDPPPLVTGEDLIAVGLRPGPLFKTLLGSVRDAQLDGDVRDRDEALAWVHEIRRENEPDE
jgi:poly(A) polymerase